MKKEIKLYKSKDFNELLNDCTEFIRQSFVVYSKAFLFIVAPPLLLIMLVDVYLVGNIIGDFKTGFLTGSGFDANIWRKMAKVYAVVLPSALLFMVLIMLQTTLIFNYAVLYENAEDPSQITVADIWERIKDTFGRVLWSYVFLTIVGFLAALLVMLVFAGMTMVLGPLVFLAFFALMGVVIYLAVSYSFYIIVRIKEDVSPMEALGRCNRLIRGHWWRTFGVLFVASIVVFAFRLVLLTPLSAISTVDSLHRVTQPSSLSFGSGYMLGITEAVSQALYLYFSAIVSMCVVVLYYSLSEEKDNISLLDEINTIGENTDQTAGQEGEY